MDKVSIIIVNYNGKKYNKDCIESIYNSDYKNIEIIVVDNCSTDDSIEEIENQFKDVVIIRNEKNGGFANATNIGIRYALDKGTNYVLLLNNDTVIDKEMISNMVKTAKENNCVVSPKIYYFNPKDTIWSAGGEINWKRGITKQYGMNEKDKNQYSFSKSIKFATGCCMLIPLEILLNVGEFIEDNFLYYEDTDYCARITNAGYKILYEPKAIMKHKVSATTGGEENLTYIYYLNRGRLYFNKKYNQHKFIFWSLFFLYVLKKCTIWIIKGKLEFVFIMFKAIKDYFNRVSGRVDLRRF